MNIVYFMVFYFFIVPISIVHKVFLLSKLNSKKEPSWDRDDNNISPDIFTTTKSNATKYTKSTVSANIEEIKGDTNPENYTFW